MFRGPSQFSIRHMGNLCAAINFYSFLVPWWLYWEIYTWKPCMVICNHGNGWHVDILLVSARGAVLPSPGSILCFVPAAIMQPEGSLGVPPSLARGSPRHSAQQSVFRVQVRPQSALQAVPWVAMTNWSGLAPQRPLGATHTAEPLQSQLKNADSGCRHLP